MALFRDRREAGQALAGKLRGHADRPGRVVLALPRGGVPVAFEVARELRAPLDVFVVRKLGLPGHEELAMGALATGGVRVINHDLVRALRLPETIMEAVTARERREMERREHLYRGERPPLDVGGRTVILVDDGVATGSSMRAAVLALRQRRPGRIVVAVPVGPPETCTALQEEADEVICANSPVDFDAVGQSYNNFSQTTDAEVKELLERAAADHVSTAAFG